MRKHIDFFLLIAFIIFILPSSIKVFFPSISSFVDYLQIFCSIVLLIYTITDKIKLNGFLITFFAYIIYLFFVTVFRGVSIVSFGKTYLINLGVLLLINIIFVKKRMYLLKNIYNFLNLIVLLNLIVMLICHFIYGSYIFPQFSTYLLGMDNRFILYFLFQIIIANFLIDKGFIKNKSLYYVYFIDITTLVLVWSASAMVVLILLFGYQLLFTNRKKTIPIYFLYYSVILINIAIIFFNIHYVFSYIIVVILGKNITLSYRTIIWGFINKNYIFSSLNEFIFGNGFVNLSKFLAIPTLNRFGVMTILSPAHMHNIIENTLFSGGIIGALIYFHMYQCIIRVLKKIKRQNVFVFNIYSIILIAIQILLIFDTFEFYPLYYIILYTMYNVAYENRNQESLDMELEFES